MEQDSFQVTMLQRTYSVLTDTGLSSNCMQKEWFKWPLRILRRLLSPLVTSLWSEGLASLHSSCCLLLAFSRSVNDEYDLIAQIAAIRPPELYDSPAPETETGLAESREQSGQSRWRVSAKDLGRTVGQRGTWRATAWHMSCTWEIPQLWAYSCKPCKCLHLHKEGRKTCWAIWIFECLDFGEYYVSWNTIDCDWDFQAWVGVGLCGRRSRYL